MTDISHPQLALHFSRKPDADFTHFIERGNEQLVARLQLLASGAVQDWLYLWGAPQSGKSHLLLATCATAEQHGRSVFYLDAEQALQHPVGLLAQLSDFALVVLDNVQQCRGHRAWQEGLFHLYNQLRDQGHCLLAAADAAPRQLELELPDLESRFSAMEIYQLQALDDAGRAAVLRRLAEQRGFSVPEEVVSYILNRADRDLITLKSVIDRLDLQSLQEKRLITIPFVKKVMGW